MKATVRIKITIESKMGSYEWILISRVFCFHTSCHYHESNPKEVPILFEIMEQLNKQQLNRPFNRLMQIVSEEVLD